MHNNRLKNEVKIHNQRYQKKEGGRKESLFYFALFNIYKDSKKIIDKNIHHDSKVLEIGCGIAQNTPISTTKFNYVGIDCSKTAINKCKRKFKSNQNYKFIEDDAHNLSFLNKTFDFTYGVGVLHHLNLDSAINEIKRVTKSNNIMFLEPLNGNPLLMLYRYLTPSSRSPDEKPLSSKDLELINKKLNGVDIHYYGLTTLLLALFHSKRIYNFLFYVDSMLSKISFLRPFFWAVIIKKK